MKFGIIYTIACLLAILQVSDQNAINPEIQGRIINGSPAVAGQYPWQVILKKEAIDNLLCGGSIISPTWVLTAGHCTYGLTSIYLMFGSILLDNDNALSMTSTNLFINPNYNNNNLNNDVSLILLPQALTFSSTIQPITLVSSAQASNTFIGTTAIIAGFGLTDDEYLENSPNLLYAQVTIINNNQCEDVFGTDVVLSSTLCAQGASGSNMSICSGDSGGPLITRNSSGDFIQIGINSFVAEDSCTEGYPSGYARVTAYLDFISSTTGITFS